MKRYRIAVIPGDGIGKEVVPEGIRVLKAAGRRFGIAFEWDELPWSCEYYSKHGEMMPKDGLESIRRHDAIFLGAVGFPGVPDHVSLRAREPGRRGAIETVPREGPRTRDIGGVASTQEVGRAIASAV